MLGDFSSIIVRIFDSISRFFANLSYRTSEILEDGDSSQNRFQKALYLVLGAIFILLYGIAGIVIGLLYLVWSVTTGRFHFSSAARSSIRTREIITVCCVCGLSFLMVFVLSRNDWARKENLYYFENRTEINSDWYEMPAINTSNSDSYIYHLRNVMETKKTASQVCSIREQVRDTMPNGLHFATVSDYLVTLLAFEQYDVLARCAELDFFMDSKNRGNARLFHYHLESACKDYFCSGRFYKSDKCLDLIFEFAKGHSVKEGRPHYNNSFYLMRLFNESIEDRYISQHRNNNVLMKIVDDVDNVENMKRIDFAQSLSQHEKDIVEYLSCVKMLRLATEDKCEYPTDRFLQIYNRTESEVLKQYSLYMALRSYGEPMGLLLRRGSVGDKQANAILKKWQFIENLCEDSITYSYLLNTMDAYTRASQLE